MILLVGCFTPTEPAAEEPQELFAVTIEEGEGGPPLAVLHGRGDRPENFARSLAGVPGPWSARLYQAPIPFGTGWSWFVDRDGVAEAADRVAAQLEPGTVVTGFSQGGYLSFALAVRHPDKVASALPIGGQLPRALWPAETPEGAPPLVVFHGQADPVVRIEPTQELVAHLESLDWPVQAHWYPAVEHTISAEMRRDWHAALDQALHPAQ